MNGSFDNSGSYTQGKPSKKSGETGKRLKNTRRTTLENKERYSKK